MNVLDLFSGISAFSLGLERAGMTTVAFVEIDPFCRRVLAKHWPEVPCYDDVRSLTAERLRAAGISVDVIAGGFPCQDISVAGRGAGITGARSGLWSEFARLIGELRPRYALVENVAALLSRGMGDVLGDLSALGYDAEWRVISAADMGAPHRRERVWIVAYPAQQRERSGRYEPAEDAGRGQFVAGAEAWRDAHDDGEAVAHAESNIRRAFGDAIRNASDWTGNSLAIAESIGCGAGRQGRSAGVGQGIREPAFPDADSEGLQDGGPARQQTRTREAIWRMALAEPERCGGSWWATEPDVGRVAHGVAHRVDRLRALGNSLVPQIPEMIGRAIMAVAA